MGNKGCFSYSDCRYIIKSILLDLGLNHALIVQVYVYVFHYRVLKKGRFSVFFLRLTQLKATTLPVVSSYSFSILLHFIQVVKPPSRLTAQGPF